MKKYLISCILVLTSIVSVNAQSVIENWEGEYEGQMIIGFVDRPNDSVSVQFELLPIVPDSIWSYIMTYNSKRYGEIIKAYEIHWDGESSTNFVLDEKDGILIEMSLMNGCFYEMFEVLDRLYTTTLRKIDDDILFDLFTASIKNKSVFNSEEDEEGVSYEVTSYKPTQHQTVLLKRITAK